VLWRTIYLPGSEEYAMEVQETAIEEADCVRAAKPTGATVCVFRQPGDFAFKEFIKLLSFVYNAL